MTVPDWLDRLARYGVPIGAGLTTAFILLGPAAERPAVGARVYGYPVEGSNACALRLHALQYRRGSYADAPIEDVRVEVLDGERVLGSRDHVVCAPLADTSVPLAAPLVAGARVRVSAGGFVLAEGALAPRPPLALAALPVDTQGEVSVQAMRGLLVPEFPEVVEVRVAAPGLALEASAQGGDVRVIRADCTAGCAWRLEVVARAPALELSLLIKDGNGERARYDGPLPLLPGGIWVAPERRDGRLLLRSAIPRDGAYVSLVGAGGRLWGAEVAMQVEPSGYAEGTVELPELPPGPTAVLVSGEPTEPPTTTARWPLGDALVVGGALERLADGMPAALAEETARRAALRTPALALILVAAAFELGYLAWRARRSQRRLASRLEGSMIQAPLSPAALLLAGGALLLLFAALALLVIWG